jgi:hypothetical protein
MSGRALIAGVALLGALAAASFGSAGARRVVGNCTRSQVRPATIIVSCADDNLVLIHLHWTSFGGSSARATGVFYENDCAPDCAAGRFHSYPIKLVVSRAKACPGGHDDYQTASATFTAKRPPGQRTATIGLSLSCPLPG